MGGLQQGVNWLADPNWALWAVTFINIWSGYPFFMISLLAGLQKTQRGAGSSPGAKLACAQP